MIERPDPLEQILEATLNQPDECAVLVALYLAFTISHLHYRQLTQLWLEKSGLVNLLVLVLYAG